MSFQKGCFYGLAVEFNLYIHRIVQPILEIKKNFFKYKLLYKFCCFLHISHINYLWYKIKYLSTIVKLSVSPSTFSVLALCILGTYCYVHMCLHNFLSFSDELRLTITMKCACILLFLLLFQSPVYLTFGKKPHQFSYDCCFPTSYF